LRQIENHNIKDFPRNEILIGEGRFGICETKMYRGKVVAVKYFKGNSAPQAVEKEALMINTLDHPGRC
jgi:predicted Ser/Thr protein kinase